MSRQRTDSLPPDNYADEPIYWFAVLEKAVDRGDHATAEAATRQLDRLGVRVRYGRPRPPVAFGEGRRRE
jgi:hypothetical protein